MPTDNTGAASPGPQPSGDPRPTLREALTPFAVGIAGATTTFLVDHFAKPEIWITAAASGLGAWLAAFAMTGRWK